MREVLRSERGSLTLELALLAPVLVALLLFVAGAATLQGARNDLDDAAWEAARVASLTRSAAGAEAAARRAVTERLDSERWDCGAEAVSVDVSRFAPGGTVAVEVSCTLDLRSAFAVFPGQMQIRSRAAEPLEPFRALQP